MILIKFSIKKDTKSITSNTNQHEINQYKNNTHIEIERTIIMIINIIIRCTKQNLNENTTTKVEIEEDN